MAISPLLRIVTSCLFLWTTQGQLHNVLPHILQPNLGHIANILANLDSKALLNNASELKFKGVNDGLDCIAELTALYKGLNSSDPLTSVYFFDAMGKPGSGVFTGNLMMLGDYDSCKAMKKASKSYFNHCKSAAYVLFTGTKTPTPLTWTGCLPKPCQGAAFDEVVTGIIPLIPQLSKYLKVLSFKTSCEVIYEYDAGAYIAVTVCGVLIALVILGSLWSPLASFIRSLTADDTVLLVNDYDGADGPAEDDGSVARPVQKRGQKDGAQESILGRILQCFSLEKSVPALLSTETKEGQIHCLNGIRFLSINWVVLGHTYFLGMSAAGDISYIRKLFNRKSFLIVINALPSVDSFFVLSGFLVSYLLLKDLTRHNGQFRFVGYYLHRYIRLSIPYGIIMLIEGWLYPIYITGNFPEAFTKEHETCSQYWWTNLLYINNLYPWNFCTNMVCMGQTWYLSNDMQFFCLAPIFVYLLWKSPIAGHVLSQCAIWGSAIAAGVITYHYGFGPTLFTDTTDENYFRYLYTAPWVRCTPYLVGILGGWTYWSFSEEIIEWGKRQNSWKKLGLGVVVWFSTIAVQYCVVFGVHCLWIYPEFSTVAKSVSYESLARIAWSIALTVQIFACQAGLGGWVNTFLTWNWLQPFSRLTYGVYLLHFGIATALITQLRHPFYYQTDFEVIVIYIGILAISYAASVLLYLFVEQPIMFLERISYRKS